MGDPILNCLTTACCPPEARQKLLSQLFQTECGLSPDQADKASEWLLKNCDLAPAGTLTPLVQEIARLAKGTPFKP